MRLVRLIGVGLLALISCPPAIAQQGGFNALLAGGAARSIGNTFGGFNGGGTWSPHVSLRARYTFNGGLILGILTEVTQIRFEGRAPNYPKEQAFLANPLYGIGLTIGSSEYLGKRMRMSYMLDIGGALIEKSTLLGKEETRGAFVIGGDLHYEYLLGKDLSLVGIGGIRSYWIKPGNRPITPFAGGNGQFGVLAFPLMLGVKYNL